ncbi:S-adenosyl-L-methionine-dependent methyltransferase [Polychaeton citri CBS 116435]|uniref:S-adenosyl-L-methionine-dependent methyltransferase n=1 Tax=Polychaeton citri CBS 116435 TaxID=1314669 RepID=A0A9P4Q666_9PEZI|nr:S-adenosyl-L-methionine-dependent methyltransferase [Polychaeton citri CBS 116435]
MATENQNQHGINKAAQTGFAKSAAYDQNRPRYAEESVQHLLSQTRVEGVKHARVLDLGAGTGLFTEALAKRPEEYEIVTVEPHEGMRGVLEAKKLQRVTTLDGKGDSIPARDESFDAIFVAQAFHWFATSETLREMHRVLKPHGAIGLLWNVEDYNAPKDHKAATEWEGKLHALIWTFDDNEPRFRHEKWHNVFEDQIKSTPLSVIAAADPLFALPLGQLEQRWTTWITKEKLWDRYSTLSQIAVLEGEDRARTYAKFSEAISHPDVETNEDGELPLHLGTYLYWTTKVPSGG